MLLSRANLSYFCPSFVSFHILAISPIAKRPLAPSLPQPYILEVGGGRPLALVFFWRCPLSENFYYGIPFLVVFRTGLELENVCQQEQVFAFFGISPLVFFAFRYFLPLKFLIFDANTTLPFSELVKYKINYSKFTTLFSHHKNLSQQL